MKYTKRSRKENIKRILRWYIKEKRISDIDIAIGMPEIEGILDDDGEMDFDDVVRAFDFLGIDVVAVPRVSERGLSRSLEWYCLNAVPYDDGGRQPEKDAGEVLRHRMAKERWNGRKKLS